MRDSDPIGSVYASLTHERLLVLRSVRQLTVFQVRYKQQPRFPRSRLQNVFNED
jgi:hypothetical protein